METIGKYKITGELGTGGFGHVYKAEDPTFGRTVAIKVLNSQKDEGMIRRFRAEAMTSANLRHKNIITVFDFEEENGVQYLVMEYLDGQNLQQLVDRKAPIPALDKLGIMAEVAEGLQYAHDQSVIHRDVKPANIMRLNDGSVKIMDFGIARMTQKSTRLTQAGYMVGTPQYMAPEQFVSDTADAQCDVWAYGVVLYEFLTGNNPFMAENPVSIIYRITREEPPPICDCVPSLPRSLDAVVRRLLAKTKAERYPSMEDLRLDLDPVIQELGKAQVANMEDTVEALIRAGKYDQAQTVVASILKFDQRNPKARKWRTDLRDFSRRKVEEDQVKALIEQADEKTTVRDFSAAAARLQEALQIDPDSPAVRTRLDQIYVEQQKRARAKSLLEEARVEFERKALTGALEHANEAVQADPSSNDAAAFLDQVRQAIEARDAEVRRKAGLNKARGLLLVQDYSRAVAVLQELAAKHPSDPEVRGRLAEALHIQSVDATEKKVAAAIGKSRDYLGKGGFQEAIGLLAGLDPEAGRNAQVQQLLSFAREQFEHQKRDAEVERLLADASAQKGDYGRALASIARALELSPDNERALRLRNAVLASRQREEALETEIESRKGEAEKLLDQGQPEAAILLLQTLSVRYQRQNTFADLLQRANLMEKEKREREAVNAILARVLGLAGSVRWDDARAAIDLGLKQFPQSAPLMAERERVIQQAELEAMVSEIQQKLARHELNSAIASAESGMGKFPAEPRLAEILQKARSERELKEMLARAEGLILADQIDEAENAMAALCWRAPADARVPRLLRMLDERRQRRQSLAAADQFRKRFAFRQARDALQAILKVDPEDAAAQSLLEGVDRESADYDRQQKVTAARTEAERLSKHKEYAAAVQVLTNIANEYPDDVEIQDDLRRARDSRDQSVQKEAYSVGCREFDRLMRARLFDQAIAKAEELIAAFPGEADLQDDLRHATEARDQAARREAYSRGRKDLSALLKNRQFEYAVEKAQELIASFPEEPELHDDLRRANEAREHAARKEAYAQGRKVVDALMKNRQFDQAIARMQELAVAFPEEPELQDELHGALENREQAARKKEFALKRKEFDALMKGRQFDLAVAKAEELVAAFPRETEAHENLSRAREARDQAARREAYIQSRKELDGLIKSREFEQAIAKATLLIATFPDEPELQDDLKRAREARDQAARKEAYAHSCQELDLLMKERRFEPAVAAAQQLIAAFPEEPGLQEVLRRAREALDHAARKEAYTRGRKDVEALVGNRQFEQAIARATALMAAFPDEPELQEDLRRAGEARGQAARQEAYARGHQEFEGLMRNRQFEQAVNKARQLIAAFPEEPQLQEDLRRAGEARDQAARQEAYNRGHQEFEGLMRARQFERAVAKAQELVAAFPTEPGGADDLKRAREAQAKAMRTLASDRGRREFDALMRERQLDQAVAKAQELANAFPEEGIFQDDLKHAVEARGQAARKAAYDQGRKEFDDLLKREEFKEAIDKAEALAKDFPDDPVIRQDLQAAKSAMQVRAQSAELERQIAELEALFRKGDSDGVRKRAVKLLQKYDDPRAKELLRWANRSQTDLKALKIEARPKDRKLLYWLTPVLIVLIIVGVYKLVNPPVPGQLRANPPDVSFTYLIGGPLPAARSFDVTSPGRTAWAVKRSDLWFRVTPVGRAGRGSVSVTVAPEGLPAGEYSGIATIASDDGSTSPAAVRVKLSVKGVPPVVAANGKAPEGNAGGPPAVPRSDLKNGGGANKQAEKQAPAKESTKPPELKPPEDKSTASSAAVLSIQSPTPLPARAEPAVDCNPYKGARHGQVHLPGSLPAGKSASVDRYNQVTGALVLRAVGDHIPGCAVTVTPLDLNIGFSHSDDYSTVTITNNGTAPVSRPGFRWQLIK